MSEESNKSLIKYQSGGLSKPEKRTNTVIERMTKDVLTATTAQIRQARYRIGEYELREPDYSQICDWAAAMDMAPEEVLNRLAESTLGEKIVFEVEAGAIISFVWNFALVPYVPGTWRSGLLIEGLAFIGDWPDLSTVLQPRLPRLERLYLGKQGYIFCHPERYQRVQIGSFDLSCLPCLTEFSCFGSELSELDLSPVPELTDLECGDNNLTKLDLSSVPDLIHLECGVNMLNELDLSPVPKLEKLDCHKNQLTELDLTSVSELTDLNCGENNLTKLDLTSVPRLTKLSCPVNKLTELDLLPVPELTTLRCYDNKLTKLDLSPVSGLELLGCYGNQFTKLDLSSVPALKLLHCSNNNLTELDLSPVPALETLWCDENVCLLNSPADLVVYRIYRS